MDSIIADSKRANEVVKKKRGRPALTDEQKEERRRLKEGGSVKPEVERAAAESAAPPLPDTPIPKEALGPIVAAPFRIAALRTGYNGFDLSDSERDGVVPLVDACLRQYLGPATTPHAAAIALGTTLAIFSGMKYMGYLQWRRDQAMEVPPGYATDKIVAPVGIPSESRFN